MIFPVYLRLGGVAIHPHLFFELLAYTAGFQVYLHLRRRYGDPVSSPVRWWVIAVASAGAAVGSKALYWLEDPAQMLAHLTEPAYLLGGKTIVGGLLGGWVAVEWTKRRIGVTTRTGDLFAVPLCIGIAIGRIGCFLTGLSDRTYGVATSLPWGVNFGDGIHRHPTQLYELVFVLILGTCLRRWVSRPHANGDIFKGFMVGYLGWRLSVDFIKPGVALFGLTGIQWACVAGLLFCARDVARWIGAQDQGSSALTGEGNELSP